MSRIAHPRFLLFIALALITVPAATFYMKLEEAVVFGFNIASIAFILASVPLWLDDRPEEARMRGARDDGGRVLLLVVSAAVLAAVVVSLARMIQTKEAVTMPDLLEVVATLLLAWLFANLIYAHHYGHLFTTRWTRRCRGLVFPATREPVFADFCYYAFCIGMTSAVSDVNVESVQMRRVTTVHALLAFIFNLGIMALVINVLSGVL